MMWMWLWTALASPPLDTVPAPGGVLPPCVPDPQAGCWRDALALTRFAPTERDPGPAVRADVRMAWASDGLLVRAELPDAQRLEVVWHGSEDAQRRWVVTDRMAVLPLPEPPEAGQRLHLQAQLLAEDERSPRTRPWAPTGPGEPNRPWPALLGEQPSQGAVRVTANDEELSIEALGSAVLTARQERMAAPVFEHPPEPWAVRAMERIETPMPPEPGWVRIAARWDDPDGRSNDLVVRRAYLPGASVTDGLPMHPPPRHGERLEGEPVRIEDLDAICLRNRDLEPAAELLAEELERFHAIELPIRRCRPGPGHVTIGGASRALPRDWRTDAEHHEGFGLLLSAEEGLRIWASTRAGAVYGALALVDALGTHGQADPFRAADRPDLPMRVLYHRIDVHHPARQDPERYRDFLRRVVARGRYNLLILNPRGALQYESRPELAMHNALTRDELRGIVEEARLLGMEVAPATDSPGHADWLIGAHPQIAEDQSPQVACTRHPLTRALVRDVYQELLELFDQPAYFHIGHDEVFWQRAHSFGDERCPRCAGTPKADLLAEHVAWSWEFLTERGARPILWADMFLEGWNGGRYGTTRTLEILEPEIAQGLLFMSWGTRGDPVANLAEQGHPLLRAQTGYQDHRRGGLQAVRDRVEGDGLALYYPAPWLPYGWASGSQPLIYFWPNVVLAGATAWRAELADIPITALLEGTLGEASYLPGYQHPPGAPFLLAPEGQAPTPLDAALPRDVEVQGVPFRVGPRAARVGAPSSVDVGQPMTGASLLHTVRMSWSARKIVADEHRKADSLDGEPIAYLNVSYSNGETERAPIYLGLDVWHWEGDARVGSLWRTSGALRLPSDAAAASSPRARDRTLYRWDWHNPRPEQQIDELRIEVQVEGVELVVGAVSGFGVE